MKRVGIDIGGTFTDLVVYDDVTRQLTKTKTLTTPTAPEEGFLKACSDHGLDMTKVGHFLHATTLVTNLIIQRGGADVGLVTTKGFRHVLEVGDGRRADTYSLQWERPKPFAPTHLVVEIDERINSKGEIVKPLDRQQVAKALRPLIDQGVKSIAVSLFHSYANAVHEKAVAEVLRELSPDVHVSLSSEIDPRIREFQRTSTTVLNAYAMPRVFNYVERLDKALGLDQGLNYMHSGGGIVPSSIARHHPIMLVESGPAAGVLASIFLGKELGIPNIITADMGGTSFDVCVIQDGVPKIHDTLEVEPTIPLRTDCIDVVSVGSGGGSIVWIDEGGALRVGPQSTASKLGPACFDRGGTDATVTDANMLLGLLNSEALLGGRLKLSRAKADLAIQPIAKHFRMTTAEAAQGVYKIVNANMAQATRKLTINQGIDPRDFTLLPFGGAGGVHAIDVARELGMRSVVFPKNASVLSAFGLLTANLKYTATKSVWSALAELSAETLTEAFEALAIQATAAVQEGDKKNVSRMSLQRSLDLRYVGQSYDLRLMLDSRNLEPSTIYRKFEALYRKRYGVSLGDPVEVTNLHVTATGHIRPLKLAKAVKRSGKGRSKAVSRRYVALCKRDIPIYERDGLHPGANINGPCIIEESDTTIFIPERCSGRVDAYGNIHAVIRPARDVAMKRRGMNPFTAEIMRSYLTSTVDEMVKTTTGAAYSTCFAEGGDFTCALFDAKGRMVAQALGLPIHAGSLFDGVKTIVSAFPTFAPGDVILMNDPYQGGSHQPDAIVARPIFYRKKLIAFSVNRGHWTDIGGMSAGGWTGSATHVVQEALIIPPVKLYKAGQLDTQIRDFLVKNVRLAKQLWGDIQSQIASNVTAENRLHDLIGRYGLEAVLQTMEHAIDYSREHLRQALTKVPDGTGQARDVLDDDGFNENKRYDVVVTLTKKGEKIIVDCAGTSLQAIGPINESLATTKGAVFAALLSLVDPQLPLNEAITEFVEFRLPEGTLVNPRYPAPVSSNYHIMVRVAENVVRAIAPLRPDLVVAGSYGDGQNVSGWCYDKATGKETIWYLFQCGGTGGRAARDGNTGLRHVLSNARSESMEIWEKRYPLFFLGYEVTTDSGGPGEFRGGFGQRRTMRLEADTLVTANTDRQIVPPAGVFGGNSGALNNLTVIRNGKEQTFKEMFGFASPSKFSNASLKRGDILVCELGGGGGYGDPLKRDPGKIEWDVKNGWVSVNRAYSDYGVRIDPATGHHDPLATRKRREDMRRRRQEATISAK